MSNQFGLSVDMFHACNGNSKRVGHAKLKTCHGDVRACSSNCSWASSSQFTKPSISSPRICHILSMFIHHLPFYINLQIHLPKNQQLRLHRRPLPSPFPRATHAANGLDLVRDELRKLIGNFSHKINVYRNIVCLACECITWSAFLQDRRSRINGIAVRGRRQVLQMAPSKIFGGTIL